MPCDVTVLVEDDALVSEEAAWLVLVELLATRPAVDGASEEDPLMVAEEDDNGTVVVSERIDKRKKRMQSFTAKSQIISYVLLRMRWCHQV